MQIPAPVRYALLALAGIAVVGTVAILVLLQLRMRPALSQSIPTMRTILYWPAATREQVTPWTGLFPVLTSLPLGNVPVEAALVRTDAGPQWYMVPAREDPLRQQARPIAPDLRGLSSAQTPIPQDTDMVPLSGFADWTALRRKEPGTYALLGQLREAGFSDPFLDRFGLPSSQGIWVQATPNGLTAVWRYGPDADGIRPSATGDALAALSPTPSLTLSLKDAASFIGASSDDPLERAALAAGVARLAGANVSLEYDVLPVLASSSVLHLHGTRNAWDRFLAEGQGDAAEVMRLTDRLLAGAGSKAATRVEEILHDGEVEGRTVKAEGAAEAVNEVRDGWTVRMAGADRGMFTAVRGGRYVISNDRAWFEQRVAAGETPASDTVAAGTAPFAAAGAALNPLRALAMPFLHGAPSVRWTVRYGGTWSLTAEAAR